MYYHSLPIEVVLMVLMIIGSVSFVLHSELWKGHLNVYFRDMEIRTMFIWIAVMTLVFAASVSASSDFSNLTTMLRRGVFMIVSAFSTTGFQNITTNQLTTVADLRARFWSSPALMAVGGRRGVNVGADQAQPHRTDHQIAGCHGERNAGARLSARGGFVQPPGPTHPVARNR